MDNAKRSARSRARERRAAAANPLDGDLARLNLERVLAEFPDELVVAGYLSVKSEINPVPVMEKLSGQGRKLCVPVVASPRLPLKFRQWSPSVPVVAAAHGIPVPATGAWLRPDILIVPLLAFDARGFRLGYGGGHYDRTLESLRNSGQVSAVGFAYASQQLDRVPTEAFDQPLDMVVTERGVTNFQDTSPIR